MTTATGSEDARVRVALRRLAEGGLVVVVDDPEREDEGDLVAAAEFVTPETIGFMAGHGRGLICAPVTRCRLNELRIPPMPGNAADPLGTAFYTGVDHAEGGTGISAADRARTIRALADPATEPGHLRTPGHVFPLAAHEDGLFGRRGHTEAAVDLMRLAGLRPAAVICEIVRPDGVLARLPDLVAFADRHGLPVLTVEELVDYRCRHEPLVERAAEAALPLRQGRFRAVGYRGLLDGAEHIALVAGDPARAAEPLVRVQAECPGGDVFGSLLCSCRQRRDRSLGLIGAAEAGVLVYVREAAARGITAGPGNSASSVSGMVDVAHHENGRFGALLGARILRDLGIRRARLIGDGGPQDSACAAEGIDVLGHVSLSESEVTGALVAR